MARHRIVCLDFGGGRSSEPVRRRFRHWLHAWEPTLFLALRPWKDGLPDPPGYERVTPAGPGPLEAFRRIGGRGKPEPIDVTVTGPGFIRIDAPEFDLILLAPDPDAGEERLAAIRRQGRGTRPAVVVLAEPRLDARLAALGLVDIVAARAGAEAGLDAPRVFASRALARSAGTCAIVTPDSAAGPFRFTAHPAALLEFGEDEYFDELVVNPYATAVRRSGPSAEARGLVARGLLKPGDTVLDYGCGYGSDVEYYKRHGIDAEGFDPAARLGFDRWPTRRFGTILLTRVLDTISLDKERVNAVQQALAWLAPGGRLYVSVRGKAEVGKRARAGRWDRFMDGWFANRRRRWFLRGFTPADLAATLAQGVSGASREPWKAPFTHLLIEGAATLDLGETAASRRPVAFVDSQAGLVRLCRTLAGERAIGLDVETTMYETPRRLCTIQVATEKRIWIVDGLVGLDLAPFGKLLGDARIAKVIHNARFEMSVFRPYGFVMRNVFDTMIASRILDGADPEYGHGLSGVCKRLLGLSVDKTQQTSNWTIRPLSKAQLDYGALDAEVLVDLLPKFDGRYVGGQLFT